MAPRQEANTAAAQKTEELFQDYLTGLEASHHEINVKRTEDVLSGRVEIKITARLKKKRVP